MLARLVIAKRRSCSAICWRGAASPALHRVEQQWGQQRQAAAAAAWCNAVGAQWLPLEHSKEEGSKSPGGFDFDSSSTRSSSSSSSTAADMPAPAPVAQAPWRLPAMAARAGFPSAAPSLARHTFAPLGTASPPAPASLARQPGPPPPGLPLAARGYATSGRGGGRRAARQPQAATHQGPRRNNEIRAREVRVVFPQEEGRPAAVMPLQTALREARQRSLDLVEVTAAADPPVVKIADYEKLLYESRKRARASERAAREQRRLSEPKEVRVGCRIDKHDLDVKMAQARRFLEDGHSLRLVVVFKGGRELALGRDMVAFLLAQLEGLVVVKNPRELQEPKINQWSVLLAPVPKKKAEAPAHEEHDAPEAAQAGGES